MAEQVDPLPEDLRSIRRRAVRLEWWTLFWLGTIVVAMWAVLGQSQAMKTAWLEDMMSLIPPALFIAKSQIEKWPPNRHFPYGYIRFGTLAFMASALALLAMGLFLLYEAAATLLRQEHPTIPAINLFGREIWLGWLMIAVLVYSVIPPVSLGRMKQEPGRRLADKVLSTDADINKADWQTGLAGIAGIIGIAFGFWWADAVAAGIISLSVVKDGVQNIRAATAELIDGAPRKLDGTEIAEDAEIVCSYLAQKFPESRVRIRETGNLMRVSIDHPHPCDPKIDLDALRREMKQPWRLQEITHSFSNAGKNAPHREPS